MIDMSPSMATMSTTGVVKLDLLYQDVATALWAILDHFPAAAAAGSAGSRSSPADAKDGGKDGEASAGEPSAPEIFATVVIHGTAATPLRTICQAAVLTRENIPRVISEVMRDLRIIKTDFAHGPSTARESRALASARQRETDMSTILKAAMFAVRHLPPAACTSVVLFTDGVAELPETCNYDNIFMRLNRQDIPVHVVYIGRGHAAAGTAGTGFASFGYVPDLDLARFIAETTGGLLLDSPVPLRGIHRRAFDFSDKSNRFDRDSCWKALPQAIFTRGSAMCVNPARWERASLRQGVVERYSGDFPKGLKAERVFDRSLVANLHECARARLNEGFRVRWEHTVVPDPEERETRREEPRGGEGEAETSRDDRDGDAAVSAEAAAGGAICFVLLWRPGIYVMYQVSTGDDTPEGDPKLRDSGVDASKKPKPPVEVQATGGEEALLRVRISILSTMHEYTRFFRRFWRDDEKQQPNKAFSSFRALKDFVQRLVQADKLMVGLHGATAASKETMELPGESSRPSPAAAPPPPQQQQQQQHQQQQQLEAFTSLPTSKWHWWFHVERRELYLPYCY